MLTEQAQHALVLLTRRADKSGDLFTLDRVDRAKDEVIRLNSSSPAHFQVRSALAHAGAVLRQRRTLIPSIRLIEVEPQEEPGAEDLILTALDTHEWLRSTPCLTKTQRGLLQHLAIGFDVEALASLHKITALRMREQISRARKHARTGYRVEVLDA